MLLIDEAGRTAIPTLADHATTVVGRGISILSVVADMPIFPLQRQSINHMDSMLKSCGGYADITSERMIDHHNHPNARGDQTLFHDPGDAAVWIHRAAHL